MSRLWAAGAILVGMVLLFTFNARHLGEITEGMDLRLEQATQAAVEGDWEMAEGFSSDAQRDWQEKIPYLRLVQSHAVINEISTLLDESLARLESRDLGEYTATNARLQRQLASIRDLEEVSAGNLF